MEVANQLPQSNQFGQGLNVNINDSKPDTESQKYFSDEEILKLPLTIGLCGWVKHVDEIETPKILGKHGKTEYNIYFAPPDDNAAMYINRICNEFCVDFMFNTIYPLITRITQSSNMSELQIYRLWRAKLRTVGDALLDNITNATYYCKDCKVRVDQYHADLTTKEKISRFEVGFDEKNKIPIYKESVKKSNVHNIDTYVNTFDINGDYITDIITDLGLYSGITSKARKGFFIREIRETFFTSSNNQPQLADLKSNMQNPNNSGGIIGRTFRGFSGEQ